MHVQSGDGKSRIIAHLALLGMQLVLDPPVECHLIFCQESLMARDVAYFAEFLALSSGDDDRLFYESDVSLLRGNLRPAGN